jgi:AcrR family transcriptional regulator
LLEAAQALFAEQGFDATSVRDITARAQCNVASVNYHFGGKDKLYVEAFRSLLEELRDLRIATIQRDMARVEEPTLEYFLQSFATGFLDPLVAGGRGRRLMILLNREMTDPHLPPRMFVDEFLQPMIKVAGDALMRVATSLDEEAARLCLMSMVSQLLHALMMREHFMPGEIRHILPGDLETHVEHIVRFSLGGVMASAGEMEGAANRSHHRSTL